MISEKNYNLLKEEFGDVSSWAIWAPERETPKSGIGDMSVFKKSNLLEILNTGYVFVGLNGSSTHGSNQKVDESQKRYWCNFHSSYSRGHDYKLRYAMNGTKYWGSYITDVIKYFPEVDSNKVNCYLKQHPEIIEKNIIELEREIELLGGHPTLVALGGLTYDILSQYLGGKYEIKKIKHYSYTIGKEDYRKELLEILD